MAYVEGGRAMTPAAEVVVPAGRRRGLDGLGDLARSWAWSRRSGTCWCAGFGICWADEQPVAVMAHWGATHKSRKFGHHGENHPLHLLAIEG